MRYLERKKNLLYRNVKAAPHKHIQMSLDGWIENTALENRKPIQTQMNKHTHFVYNVWVIAHNSKVIRQMHLEVEKDSCSNSSLHSTVLLCKA